MWCFVTVCVTGMFLRVLGYAVGLLGVLAGRSAGYHVGLVEHVFHVAMYFIRFTF